MENLTIKDKHNILISKEGIRRRYQEYDSENAEDEHESLEEVSPVKEPKANTSKEEVRNVVSREKKQQRSWKFESFIGII